MPLAILKLLEELALRLVVQVGVLRMLYIPEPNSRVDNLRLRLYGATHALGDGELDVVIDR